MTCFMSLTTKPGIEKPCMCITIIQQLDTLDKLRPTSSSVKITGGQA